MYTRLIRNFIHCVFVTCQQRITLEEMIKVLSTGFLKLVIEATLNKVQEMNVESRVSNIQRVLKENLIDYLEGAQVRE